MILDREGGAESAIRRLTAAGHIEPDSTFLADRGFEEDNFSIEELIEFVRARGAAWGASLEPTPEHVRERHAVGRKGLAEVLLAEAAVPEHGSVRVSKPELTQACLNT